MLLSPRSNSLESLFEELRVFKETVKKESLSAGVAFLMTIALLSHAVEKREPKGEAKGVVFGSDRCFGHRLGTSFRR